MDLEDLLIGFIFCEFIPAQLPIIIFPFLSLQSKYSLPGGGSEAKFVAIFIGAAGLDADDLVRPKS